MARFVTVVRGQKMIVWYFRSEFEVTIGNESRRLAQSSPVWPCQVYRSKQTTYINWPSCGWSEHQNAS